jgi:hypothetical protein
MSEYPKSGSWLPASTHRELQEASHSATTLRYSRPSLDLGVLRPAPDRSVARPERSRRGKLRQAIPRMETMLIQELYRHSPSTVREGAGHNLKRYLGVNLHSVRSYHSRQHTLDTSEWLLKVLKRLTRANIVGQIPIFFGMFRKRPYLGNIRPAPAVRFPYKRINHIPYWALLPNV